MYRVLQLLQNSPLSQKILSFSCISMLCLKYTKYYVCKAQWIFQLIFLNDTMSFKSMHLFSSSLIFCGILLVNHAFIIYFSPCVPFCLGQFIKSPIVPTAQSFYWSVSQLSSCICLYLFIWILSLPFLILFPLGNLILALGCLFGISIGGLTLPTLVFAQPLVLEPLALSFVLLSIDLQIPDTLNDIALVPGLVVSFFNQNLSNKHTNRCQECLLSLAKHGKNLALQRFLLPSSSLVKSSSSPGL